MNLFASSHDPVLSAQALDDSRVIKMVLETAQMICTVMSMRGEKQTPYKSTHPTHPVTLWCNRNDRNFYWLLHHHKALSEEYTYRTGKTHSRLFRRWSVRENADFNIKIVSFYTGVWQLG